MAKHYVASSAPAFVTGSMAYADQKPHYWRTHGPESDVRTRQGQRQAPLSTAEKRARDRRFGFAF